MDAHVLMKLSSSRFGDICKQKKLEAEQRRQASKASICSVRYEGGRRACFRSKMVGNSACTSSAGSCRQESLWKSFKTQNLLPRIHATPGSEESDSESCDVWEVIDTVLESETKDMPENAKEAATPPQLPEGEPSPFSSGVDLDADDRQEETSGSQSHAAAAVE